MIDVDGAWADAALRSTGLAEASLLLSRVEAGGAAPLLAVRPNASLYPASMIKTPIAAALGARWAAGSLSRDDRMPVEAANLTANDAPSPLVEGYRARLDELAELMLTRSDNVATNVLIDVLGRESITAFAREAGLPGTAVRCKVSGSLPLIEEPGTQGRNAHPPAEAARLFEAIALDRLPESAWLRDLLARQEWNGKLSGGLAPGDRFAHKTGDTDDVSHDGGILTTATGRRYVVVVYAPTPSPDGDDPRFAELMRALRAHL